LRNPKAVYLFGCNTLAAKEKDGRTEQEYIEVLVRDGFALADAERLAQARYGVFGDSFGERMRRVFLGDKVIYGFDSIGPSGKTVQGPLEKYFKSLKSVQAHFTAKVMHAKVDVPFMKALDDSAVTYSEGLSQKDKLFQPNQQMCKMLLPETKVEEKLKLANSFLNSDLRHLALPQVMNLFLNYKDLNPKRFSPTELAALKELTENKLAKSTLIQTAYELTATPVLQAQTYNWFFKVGWLSSTDYQKAMTALLEKLALKKTSENLEAAKAIFMSISQVKEMFALSADFALEKPLTDLDLAYLKSYSLSPALSEKVLDLLLAQNVVNLSLVNSHLVKTVQGSFPALPMTQERLALTQAKSSKFLDLFRSSYLGIKDILRDQLTKEVNSLSGEAFQKKICTQESKTLLAGALPVEFIDVLRPDPLKYLLGAQCLNLQTQLRRDSSWLVPAVLEAYANKTITAYKAVELLNGLDVPTAVQNSSSFKELVFSAGSTEFSLILEKAVLERLATFAKAKNTQAMTELCESHARLLPTTFFKLQPEAYGLRINFKTPEQFRLMSCFGFRKFDQWLTLIETHLQLSPAERKTWATKLRVSDEQALLRLALQRFDFTQKSDLFTGLIRYLRDDNAKPEVVTSLRFTQNSADLAHWMIQAAKPIEDFERRVWLYEGLNLVDSKAIGLSVSDERLLKFIMAELERFSDEQLKRFVRVIQLMSLSLDEWKQVVLGHPRAEIVFNALEPKNKLKVGVLLLNDSLPLKDKAFLVGKVMSLKPTLDTQHQILLRLPVSPENYRLLELYREQFDAESVLVQHYFQ
jgi:hypothetical protein